jgi:hypothetical protein
MLKERIDGAHSTTLDRGARILAYHRFLLEYRVLVATWGIRVSAAAANMDRSAAQQKVRNNQVQINNWTPQTDVQIANSVLSNRKY